MEEQQPCWEDFLAFTVCRSMDVIYSAQFKRHLSTCRERGDPWAVDMSNAQGRMAARCKEWTTQMLRMQSDTLKQVCRDVINSSQPPVKLVTVPGVCAISGQKIEHCLNLTRLSKNSKSVLVHTRYWHFCIFLWYCSKLEYIVRAYAKNWLESQGPVSLELDQLPQLMRRFTEQNQDNIVKMHRLYQMAAAYASASLKKSMSHDNVTPVLQPPPGYFMDGPEIH